MTGITHSQSTLDYALEHAYICEGRNENFDDLVQNADYIILACTPLCCWNGSSSTATWSAPARW